MWGQKEVVYRTQGHKIPKRDRSFFNGALIMPWQLKTLNPKLWILNPKPLNPKPPNPKP